MSDESKEQPRAIANPDVVPGIDVPDPLIRILVEALAEAEEAAYNWENTCTAANARIAELEALLLEEETMCNVPQDIQRSLAIVLRSVLEHTDEGSALGAEAEKCERWLAELPDAPTIPEEATAVIGWLETLRNQPETDWEDAPSWANS